MTIGKLRCDLCGKMVSWVVNQEGWLVCRLCCDPLLAQPKNVGWGAQ